MSVGHRKIIVATILFSVSPLLVKILTLDAVSILWTVSLIGSVSLFLKILAQRRLNEFFSLRRYGLLLLVGLAVTNMINNVFFNLSIKTTTVANAVLTHYLAPIFLLLFSIYLFKEKISSASIIALVLSLLGLIVLLSPQEITLSNTHFVGLLLGTFSAVFFAAEIAARKKLSHTYKADMIIALFLSLSVIFLLPFISFSSIVQLNVREIALFAVYGVIIVAFGMSLHTSGLKVVKAHNVGILNYIEPLGAILWGILFLSEALSASVLIGGSLILVGGYLVVRQSVTKKSSLSSVDN